MGGGWGTAGPGVEGSEQYVKKHQGGRFAFLAASSARSLASLFRAPAQRSLHHPMRSGPITTSRRVIHWGHWCLDHAQACDGQVG